MKKHYKLLTFPILTSLSSLSHLEGSNTNTEHVHPKP